MLLALAAALSVLQQQPVVLDVPVFQDSAWRVVLPRPFDDWVFAPYTARGTTTVIFQPQTGHVSDQLYGALVLTRWGRPVPLDSVAARRVRSQWRPTLGPTFAELARDTMTVAGWPCVRLAVSGTVQHAVLEVEEFLIARDSDLVVLQLRYPRGEPRDSIAAGYRRSIQGLRLGREGAIPVAAPWRTSAETGQLTFDLPDSLSAVAPGVLTTDASSAGRHLMRWRPILGAVDTALFAVGRFHAETRRSGRLTIRIWRAEGADSLTVRAGEDVLEQLASDFSTFWRDFGPIPLAELAVVETPRRETRGASGTVFLGADVSAAVLARELSRTWWGGAVRADSAPVLVSEALPLLAARIATADSSPASDPRLRVLLESQQTAGPARFREAIRTLVVESRNGGAAVDRLLQVLGPNAAEPVRQLIFQQ